MPGAIGWAAQVLSPGGGIKGGAAAGSVRGFLLGRISLPGFRGSQADGREALVVVASLATGVGDPGVSPGLKQPQFARF